jgi:regulator of RNase E activity RraA
MHADQHGVLLVPKEVAPEIPRAAAEVAEREARIMGVCREADFSLEKLRDVYEGK